jgi:hypothetical protein
MPWVLMEFIWRRKHAGDVWGGLISSLKNNSFTTVSNHMPLYTEDILQPGDIPVVETNEEVDEDDDADTFIDPNDEEYVAENDFVDMDFGNQTDGDEGYESS